MTERLWLVTNRASGSNSEDAVHAVCEGLASAGAEPVRVSDVTDGLPDREALIHEQFDHVAVFAGDGTVNALATSLEGWEGALLVLPGGTANLLAGALHPGREAAAIAASLPRLQTTRRACIRGPDLTALVEVLAGPGATWSDVREGLREGSVGEVAGAAVAAIRQSTTGPMVALTDPPLGRVEGYAGVRLEVAEAGMIVEGYGAETVGDYLKQGIALLRRNFREGPHEDLGRHASVHCRSLEAGSMPLMVDGERREGAAELRFSLAPLALDLFVSP